MLTCLQNAPVKQHPTVEMGRKRLLGHLKNRFWLFHKSDCCFNKIRKRYNKGNVPRKANNIMDQRGAEWPGTGILGSCPKRQTSNYFILCWGSEVWMHYTNADRIVLGTSCPILPWKTKYSKFCCFFYHEKHDNFAASLLLSRYPIWCLLPPLFTLTFGLYLIECSLIKKKKNDTSVKSRERHTYSYTCLFLIISIKP